MLGTIAAVSGLVGAAIAPKITKTSALWNIFLVSSSVQFVLALLPLVALMFPATARPLFIVFDALWGLSMTLSNISGGAYTVAAVNSESLGRTTAAYRTVTMGSVPVAAILGGFLADTCGLIVPLIIWPAMLGVATLVFFLGTVGRQVKDEAR